MIVSALADTHTFWTVAIGIGAVVLAVVVILMMLLLSYLKDIGKSVTSLVEVGEDIADNTASIPQLAKTGPVLERIRDEALIHDDYLKSQAR